MRAQKLLLIIFTGVLSALFLFVSILSYIVGVDESNSFSALFFLGCTGAFSVYFHMKTKELYPFAYDHKSLNELSKKYWALHIAYGLILSILGSSIIVLWFTRDSSELMILIIGIMLFVLGIWTLIDTYLLNKFIVAFKKMKRRQEEIDEITGVDSK